MKTLFIIFILTINLIFVKSFTRDRNDKKHRVICAWGSWSYYRPGEGTFTTDNIDPKLCTHLVYTYAKLNTNHTIGVFDPYLDVTANDGIGAYHLFNDLRKQNPHLTTMIAINGWNYKHMSLIANVSEHRKTLINSIQSFLSQYNFDGIDLNWEYPGYNSGTDDKANLVLLLEEMHSALQKNGFVLSMSVSSQKKRIDSGYDMRKIANNVDFINLLAFDFHNSDIDTRTQPNAPLNYKQTDTEFEKEMNVKFAVNYWIQGGADPNKIVLGLAFFGNTYTLKSNLENSWKSMITGPGNAGNITKTPGILGYNEICYLLRSEPNLWSVHRDEEYKIPYITKGDQFISFDDTISIKEKLDFLKEKGLSGAMIMSLESDDFHGRCGNGSRPLTSFVMNELK